MTDLYYLKYFNNYYLGFTEAGLKNKMGALDDFERLKADYEADNAEYALDKRTNDQAWSEFVAWRNKNRVNLSTRVTKIIKDALWVGVHRRNGFKSRPSLWAWYEIGNEVFKADSSSGGYEFEKAYQMCVDHKTRQEQKTTEHEASLKASVEYCITNGLNWSVDTAISIASEHYAEKLIKDAEEEGQSFKIKFCDECNEWTAGAKRCSCGNRRVDLVWDGVYPNVYIYPEPY